MGNMRNAGLAELKAELKKKDLLIRQLEEELEAVRKGRDMVVAINADLIEELNGIRELPDRHTGRVKFFVPEGWGFIVPDDGGAEIFVHYRYVRGHGRRELLEGARVAYEVATGDRGTYANDVVLLQDGDLL